MLIDRFVPTYQFVERHSRTIPATPPRVYRALWEADFARSTVIRRRMLAVLRNQVPHNLTQPRP